MTALAKATQLLRSAEAQLRELLAAAASDGHYADVVKMAAWARTIAELVGDESPRPPDAARDLFSTAPLAALPAGGIRPKRDHRAAYPKFFRNGDRLIRVSWSKREQKEYEHKAPRKIVDAVVQRLKDVGAGGRVFSSDEILSADIAGDGATPSYQIYAVIGLLRHVGLIDQHGRQGYSVSRLSELESSLTAVWNQLPKR